MAYTPNPANANGVNESEYLADFMRNQAAIEAHKRRRGGSYEDAYRAVTGRPWPDGRSVKVNGGRAEMTKDRTVKSVVGKYVLPAAGAALTGGAALGVGPLAGVFGGAAASGGAGSLASAGAVGSAPAYVPSSMIGMGLGGSGAGAMSAADFLGNKPSLAGRVGRGALDAATGDGDGGMSWWQQAAIAGLSGVPALVAASQNKPSAEELALQQQIKDSLASQQRRYNHQSPLFEAVTQLAMSRLPTASQRPLNPLEEG